MNRPGRALNATDRLTIKRALYKMSVQNFAARRMLALVCLTWGSGLRLSEALSLNIGQILDAAGPKRWRVKSRSMLRADQAKRKRSRRFWIPREARNALLGYVRVAHKKQLISIPNPDGPLFVSGKGNRGHRLAKRTLELQWISLQRKIGVSEPYRWHDLRHEAASNFAKHTENPFLVREFLGVRDLATTGIYVHSSDSDILEIAERM